MGSRDDFSTTTKNALANRVGQKCSNPECRRSTSGPNSDPQKYINIGIASHICAAAQGGPRYDESMTSEERKSFNNGIWLCQTCSKLIDTDIIRYSKDVLTSWKDNAERFALAELESISSAQAVIQDKEVIKFYSQCFDRPAFQDHINQEGRMEDFDKAIEDTIIAINTGVLRTREGEILKRSDGKAVIQNHLWREKLESISQKLCLIRRRLKQAKVKKAYTVHGEDGDVFYCFYDRELAEWFNSIREEILNIFSTICREAGLPEVHFQRRRYKW